MSSTAFSYVLLRLIRFCFFYLQHLGQPLDKNGNAYTSWVYSSVVVEVGKMEDVEFVVKKLQDMGYQTTNMEGVP